MSSCRSRPRQESGQTLILTVLAMFVLMAITAFAIDVSMVLLARHQAQVAADSGALAAAQDLTGGASDTDTTQDAAATRTATTLAQDNDPGSSVQVTAPYGTGGTSTTDGDSAQTVVSKSVSLPFASALGLSTTVKATAVAHNNLVQNGSFNATSVSGSGFIEYCAANGQTNINGATPNSNSQYTSCTTPNTNLGGWTVYSGGVDMYGPGFITAPSSDPAAQSLDLVGSCSYSPSANPITCTNQPDGTIYEKLNTIAGDTYTLTFDYNANPDGGQATNPAYKEFSAWVSNSIAGTYGFTYGTGGTAGTEVGPEWYAQTSTTNWTPGTGTFTATAASTYLWFWSQVQCVASNTTGTLPANTVLAPHCRYGAVISDISVTGPNSLNLTQ